MSRSRHGCKNLQWKRSSMLNVINVAPKYDH